LSLLDVGGGIGAIQLELLQAGASSAVDVEAAPAYLKVAQEEAARRGLTGRITYLLGDFAELVEHLEHADIITLDRVICCYPDMPALLGRSAAKARRRLGLVYPRTHWLMRLARPIVNLVSRLRHCPFRFYLHSPAAIDDLIRSAGFVPLHQSHTPLWNIAVYGRGGAVVPLGPPA
jgi:magnesium-protoporphyrin O-methyltransferase